MKKLQKLMDHCVAHDLNCALTWQKINGYSIEIYRGYGNNGSYKKFFYTDGHSKPNKAIKEAFKFLK